MGAMGVTEVLDAKKRRENEAAFAKMRMLKDPEAMKAYMLRRYNQEHGTSYQSFDELYRVLSAQKDLVQ
jgi:hypothetical protein